VSFNDVSRDETFYTTTVCFVTWMGPFSQERQGLWLTKDDLKDTSSWSCPPLLILRDIHSKAAQLSLPEFNRLFETSFVCDESSDSTGDVAVISSQDKVTVQILSHCQTYIVLKLSYTDSCITEQLSLISQQCMVATVEDSVLRTKSLTDILFHLHGHPDPSDCGEATRDLIDRCVYCHSNI
jgi:hypothetical protein